MMHNEIREIADYVAREQTSLLAIDETATEELTTKLKGIYPNDQATIDFMLKNWQSIKDAALRIRVRNYSEICI